MTSSIDTIDITESRLRFVLARLFENLPENELFEYVLDEDLVLRTSAAQQIQRRGTDAGFQFAMSLVNSSRFENREIASFILGQLAAPNYKFIKSSVESLLKLLSDPYYEVRTTTVYAFSFCASHLDEFTEVIVSKIVSLSSDSNFSVRLAVAHTLGYIYSESAKNCLYILRNDEMIEVRNEAECSLDLHIEHEKSE